MIYCNQLVFNKRKGGKEEADIIGTLFWQLHQEAATLLIIETNWPMP